MINYGKYSLVKFANFVYICITRGKSYHFRANFASKVVTFSVRNTNYYNYYQGLRTSEAKNYSVRCKELLRRVLCNFVRGGGGVGHNN